QRTGGRSEGGAVDLERERRHGVAHPAELEPYVAGRRVGCTGGRVERSRDVPVAVPPARRLPAVARPTAATGFSRRDGSREAAQVEQRAPWSPDVRDPELQTIGDGVEGHARGEGEIARQPQAVVPDDAPQVAEDDPHAADGSAARAERGGAVVVAA